jgi:hypothetical protein
VEGEAVSVASVEVAADAEAEAAAADEKKACLRQLESDTTSTLRAHHRWLHAERVGQLQEEEERGAADTKDGGTPLSSEDEEGKEGRRAATCPPRDLGGKRAEAVRCEK